MKCLTDEQLASLVIGGPDRLAGGHVAHCLSCSERLAALLTRMQAIEAAFAAPDPGHASGRERLLDALRQEPVPASLFWRIVMNRRNWVAAAAAAAAVIAVAFFGWPGKPPSALAEALRPFTEARSFACDMVALKGGKPVDAVLPPDRRGKLKMRLTWAAPGSLRLDTTVNGKPQSRVIHPHGKPAVMIDHAARQYTPMDGKSEGKAEGVLRLINTLAAYAPGDAKPSGTEDIDGVKAQRFDLQIADAEKRAWHYRIWVHPATRRALRLEFSLLPGKLATDEDAQAARLENFAWGLKTDGVFDTTPPAGYKLVAVKPDEMVEQMTKLVTAALRKYQEAVGGYPQDEPFNGPKAVENLEKISKKRVNLETLQGLVLVGVLQATSHGKYHGKTVGPADKDKVLFRWRLDDGRYRIIFGDLKVVSVSAERLKEVEGK